MRLKVLNTAMCFAIAVLVVSNADIFAQETPLAIVGAHIITISGEEIPDGVIVLQAGKITAVGPVASTVIPDGADRLDGSDKVVMPGLVDTHSHIAQVQGSDNSAPLQPDVRVLDAINVRDARVQKAQAGGLTTVNIMSGSGMPLSGQTIYLKLREATVIDDIMLYFTDGRPMGGIKMANGTNPIKDRPKFPGTRAKTAALIREQYIKAQEYREKMLNAEEKPDRDLALDALVEVLERRRTVHFHTHRHDDILTAIRLSKEFDFRVVLHHLAEGFRVAEQVAQAGVLASIILVDSPGGKLEAMHASLETAAVLEQAGVVVGFHTDDAISDSRIFFRQAGLAVRAGMTRTGALYALTMAGARMLELEDRIGSLEPGKDADFVILSGDPLSTYTKVLETWVEGQKVFDRSNPKDRLYAVGGYGASHDQAWMGHEEDIH